MNKVQTQFAFTDNGAKAVIVDGDEFDFTVIGDLGGGAVYIEETTITWRQSGLADEATWEADTSIPDMWSAVEWDDAPDGRFASSVPTRKCKEKKSIIRVRLAGATSPNVKGNVIVYRP